jgi:hypothetical protein
MSAEWETIVYLQVPKSLYYIKGTLDYERKLNQACKNTC